MGLFFQIGKQVLMRTSLLGSKRLWKIVLLSQAGTFLRGNLKNSFKNRSELYEYLNDTFIREKNIYFLEFGVYKGYSINTWLSIHKNANSRFFGFDTFEGLPEDWIKITTVLHKGEFSTEGHFPQINDGRVSFIKGLFQDTLDKFLGSFIDDRQKVIHMDADLFSSTLYVLTKLDNKLHRGDIIIFDEFTSGDEYLAFVNYADSYCRKYEILGVSGESYQQVAIRIL